MANSKPPSAHRRDPDRTREAILLAAQHEFAAKGLSGGRVDEIARRAHANKRMIYHYFGNKDGLYLAALERVYEELRGTENTLDLAHLAPAAAIRRLVEFTFDYSRRHPELISLINNENLHRARHLRKSKKVRELHSPFVKLLDDILRRGVAEGVFRPVSIRSSSTSPSPPSAISTSPTIGRCRPSLGAISAARRHAAGASGTMSNSF
jgi:TetR/AcrR family transcriptional regulator